jgi:hypothetical protein
VLVRWRQVTGSLLVVVGCIGLVTVADDVRHTGELIGVGGILAAGLVLLVAGSDYAIKKRLALHCVAVGVGIGAAVGVAVDSMPTGVAGGAALGTIGAVILKPRRPRSGP